MNDFFNDIILICPDYKSIIDDNYNELLNEHIDEFNQNIKPHIDFISSNDYNYFEQHDIIVLDGINIKTIWNNNISEVSKMNILKYLQTLYLISNFMNKDKDKDNYKKILSDLKSSNDEIDTIADENIPESNLSNSNDEDPLKEFSKMFGDSDGLNSITKIAKELADELQQDNKTDMENVIKGDNTAIFSMMQKINQNLDKKFKNNEINPADLMKDASKLMENMNNNDLFKNMMKQSGVNPDNLNRKEKKRIKKKLQKHK